MLRLPLPRCRLLTLCATLLLSACGDDGDGPLDAAVQVPAFDAAAIDTTAIDTANIDTANIDTANIDGASAPGPLPSGIVVVNSDYSASSVSLLDLDGNLRLDGCLSSGSGPAGMTMALSGDVVLPTQPAAGGPIAVVDRGNAAITWVDPATCSVLGQLGVGTGFASNPHDYLPLSATKAYVTRQDENKKASHALDDLDEGNDVLVIDPSQPKIVGRIDLLPFAPAGTLPRADRAVLANGSVFVSLNASSADYTTYGNGRLVIIDPTTDRVTGTVDLPGFKNCGALTYEAQRQWLLVACSGAYSDGAAQAAASGVLAVDLGKTPPVVVDQVGATTLGTAPLSNLTLASFDGIVALAVSQGSFTGTPPDGLWALPVIPAAQLPAGPRPTKLFDSTEGFALGAVLYDRHNDRVLAADATMATAAALRIFARSGDGFSAWKTVTTNAVHKLPPRALAFH